MSVPSTADEVVLCEGAKKFMAVCGGGGLPKPGGGGGGGGGGFDYAGAMPMLRQAQEDVTRRYGGPYLSIPRIEDIWLPAGTGDGSGGGGAGASSSSFMIRVYWPIIPSSSSKKLPVVLYAHGGGWLRGNVNSHDQLCRRLCLGSKRVVISVDYRLSPEHHFPTHVDDFETSYRWILEHHHELDVTQIALAGDSAGGNLCCALMVRLATKLKTEIPLQHRPNQQILIYPALDLTGSSGDSFVKYADGYGLTTPAYYSAIQTYLGTSDIESATARAKDDAEISPLRFPDASIFPPTLLVSAEIDPLLSDAIVMNTKLIEAKVPVKHVIYPGTLHAFLPFFDWYPEAAQAVEEMLQFLKK